MSILALQSSKSFRQFRVAALGVAVFLRLAWAFLIALNAFSLTTQVDATHRGVSIFMFSVNAAAFGVVVIVGLFEAFKTKVASFTSRVNFEIGWMSCFWVLETAGATIFTILRPSFDCGKIIRIQGDATGAIFAAQATLSAQRTTTPGEASTCRISNTIVFIGSWVAVGLSLIYLVYFFLLCREAYKRDSNIWHSQINKIDWSITSDPAPFSSPEAHPEKIERPPNPHLSKDYNNDSLLSLPPVFINPFDIRKESFESSVSSKKGMPLDRHQIMAQYQPPAFETSFRPLVLPEIVQNHQSTMRSSTGVVSVLGLEGMDRPASEFRKSRPTLSIHIPSQESPNVVPIGAGDEDYEKIGRTMSAAFATSPMSQILLEHSEETCTKIGRHMSMPFASPITDESGSSGSKSPMDIEASSSTKAIASHVSLSNTMHRPSRSSSQINAYTTNIPTAIQTVNAANGYPKVQHTPKRQSTMINQDSMTVRRAMRFPPNASYMSYTYPAAQRSGAVLPLHVQDLPANGHQRYYQAPHARSRSDTLTVQPSYDSTPALYGTWAQGYIPPQSHAPRRGNAPVFRPPPPPSHSPLQYTPSPSSMQAYGLHSRSSSAPSYQTQPATAALLEALRPVIRNSGMFYNSSVPSFQNAPSAYNSRPTSAAPHPSLDDNGFGSVRSAPQTPNDYEEMTVPHSTTIETERRKPQRSSKLRKPLPRNM